MSNRKKIQIYALVKHEKNEINMLKKITLYIYYICIKNILITTR